MKLNKKDKVKIFLASVFVGLLNGFLGGGGGMVLIPLLENFLKLETKKAHATAIFVMLPLSIISAVVYLISRNVDIFSLGFVGVGSVVGAIVGAVLLSRLNSKVIRIIFAVVLLIAGVKMIVG